MKFFISLVLTAFLSMVACLYLPWWSIAIIAFIVYAFIPQSAGASFLSAFLALFLFWGILSLYISMQNHHILADRVSLLILKTESPALLILLTAFIGGVVSGLAGLAASFLHVRK